MARVPRGMGCVCVYGEEGTSNTKTDRAGIRKQSIRLEGSAR